MFKFLSLFFSYSLASTSNTDILTQEKMLINNEPCGDNPANTFFISKDSEFSQVNRCPVINSSIFINGEYDITTLSPMENITQIYGDLVIQNSHNIYNLKGLQNIQIIEGNDLYLDRYAVYLENNENLGFVDKLNWTQIVFGNEIYLNHNSNLDNLQCYNQCDGCFGPGPYLCQNCLTYTFLDNTTCTRLCENVVSDNLCQVRPPNNLFIDYAVTFSIIYVDWGSNDVYRDLIDSYEFYLDDRLIVNTSINDNHYVFSQNNLVITKNIENLVPGTTYNLTVVAHSGFGYSEPFIEPVTLKEYVPDNFTNFTITNVGLNRIVFDFDSPLVPDEVFFTNNSVSYFYEYYINDGEQTGITYNNSLSLYNLTYGPNEIFIKPVVQVEHENGLLYFSGSYQRFSFTSLYSTTQTTTQTTTESTKTPTTTTTKTTTTTTITTISQPVTHVPTYPVDNTINDALIALYVFLAILGLTLIYVTYRCYKNNQKKVLLQRLKDEKVVQYSNPVYETSGYSIEDTSSFRNATPNPIYEDNDPEKDYYTV